MAQTNILLETGTNELEVVEFFIDEQAENGETYTGYYGMNVAKVLEIIRKPEVTEMPESQHKCLMGAFNLRSKVVPLIDLSIWLNKTMVESEAQKVIVTEFNSVTNSFLVSGVNRIHRLSWEQVEPPGKQLTEFSDECVTGVVKFDNRILMILDMEKIVADLNPKLGLKVDSREPVSRANTEKPVRILFADDSSMIRKTMQRGLTQAGFEVELATDGRAAWERLLEIKQQSLDSDASILDTLNIVISDIEMPSMDGHNLTKRIKDDPVLKELPVILFSSLITDILRHKGASVGADEQISKPDIPKLTDVVKKLLSERQGFTF